MAARKGATRNHRGPTRPKQRAFLSGTLRVGAPSISPTSLLVSPYRTFRLYFGLHTMW